jgi:MoxR-like ATPase
MPKDTVAHIAADAARQAQAARDEILAEITQSDRELEPVIRRQISRRARKCTLAALYGAELEKLERHIRRGRPSAVLYDYPELRYKLEIEIGGTPQYAERTRSRLRALIHRLIAASQYRRMLHLAFLFALISLFYTFVHALQLPCGLSQASVCGQTGAKRALEIAAAGGHNLLFVGPPGCGKTMLARRLPSILPPMTANEALEVTKIYSVAGLLGSEPGIVRARPFRFPHHTISQTALVGGGSAIKPGEISLAHHGVLFLDELPEFTRAAIEVMRQPLEEGMVTIARAAGTFTYPARFMLVASMNPCPCGYRGTRSAECRCDDAAVAKYVAKLSGPLLDRIDLQIEIARVPFDDMVRGERAERSSAIRERVLAARAVQMKRFAGTPITCNAEIPGSAVRTYCALDAAAMDILSNASARRQFSARALDRIARAARTIADLAACEHITAEHVAEAIHYRSLERLDTRAA